jgi:prepilin-type processing-associated H-X9-DG protein
LGWPGGLAFADGHAEIKKWRDSNMINDTGTGDLPPDSPDPGDLDWLMARRTIVQQKHTALPLRARLSNVTLRPRLL